MPKDRLNPDAATDDEDFHSDDVGDDEMELLTEEEIEALKDVEDAEEEVDAAPESDETEEEDEHEEEAVEAKDEEDDADSEEEVLSGKQEEEVEAKELEPEQQRQVAVQQKEEDPEVALGVKVQGLITERDQLGEKLENDEISLIDYHRKLNKINDDINEANQQIAESRFLRRAAETRRKEDWEATCNEFYAEEGNSIFRDNEVLSSALNAAIKNLDREGNEKKSLRWFLDEAKKNVVETMSNAVGKKAEPEQKPKPKVEKPDVDTKKLKAKAKGKPPKTISEIPEDTSNEIEDDEFTQIDRLEGEAYELAVARLSPEKYREYSNTRAIHD